jgi:hypothetical protein
LLVWVSLCLSIFPIVFIDGQMIQGKSLINGNLEPNFLLKFGFMICGLAFLHFTVDAWIKRSGKKFQNAQTWGMIAAVVAIVFFLYGQILNADWWKLDDHEIMALLGTDGKMGIGELLFSLSHSEILYFGDYPRFRPIYWLLRILETILWGKNVHIWFAVRLFYFAIFLFLFWKILNQFIDFWNAGLLTLYVAINPFWVDIFTRLGPSEVYASLGLGLLFLGFFPLLQAKPSRLLDWLIFSIGMTLCVGSKENMLFLVVFLLYAIVVAFKNREKKRAVLLGLLNAGMILLVLVAVFLSINKTGADIHSIPTDLDTRIKDLIQFLSGTIPISIILSAGVCILCDLVLIKNKPSQSENQRPPAYWYYFLVINILWLVFSQKLFYPGNWPLANRYAFPGLLFIPILIAGNLRYFQNLAIRTNFSAIAINFTLSCILTAMILAHGFNSIRDLVQQQVAVTTEFSNYIERITTKANEKPDAEIVIGSSYPLDYETIFSIIRFLRANALENRVFLDYVSIESTNTHLKVLEDYLIAFSKLGSYKEVFINDWEYWQGDHPKRLLPLDQFDPNQPCILLNLSGEHKRFASCLPVK